MTKKYLKLIKKLKIDSKNDESSTISKEFMRYASEQLNKNYNQERKILMKLLKKKHIGHFKILVNGVLNSHQKML